MNQKRFVALLWAAKVSLFVVLVYMGFEVATDRLRLGAMFHPDSASGEVRTGETQVALPETRSPSDYAEIAQSDLFTNGAGISAPGAALQTEPVLDSMGSAQELGLHLIGAVAGGTAASRAVIRDTQSNTTGVYKIGDKVASATVTAIRRDAVILQYQGRPLVLRQEAGQGEGPGRDIKSERKIAQDAGQKPQDSAAPSSLSQDSSSGPCRAGSMTDLFRKATIEPFVKNNQTEGLKITGLENLPMAALLGLQNGDIVQSINGQRLTSKQKAFQVLMKARTQSNVDIQLLRDGKSKNLSFKL